METRDLLRFLASELESAVNGQEHERIAELGSAVEVVYEAAKFCNDRHAMDVLDRMNYVCFHYRSADSFTEMNLNEIAKQVA
jgi:hypothetical protein